MSVIYTQLSDQASVVFNNLSVVFSVVFYGQSSTLSVSMLATFTIGSWLRSAQMVYHRHTTTNVERRSGHDQRYRMRSISLHL
jgi:hypothetical protein